LLLAFGDTSGAPADTRRAYEYISNWNYRLTKEDIATTIFHQFLTRLMANTFRDEMGDSLYHDFVILYTVPLRILTRLVEGGTSPWFDDVRTDTLETRDDILRRSLREALDTLRVLRGADQSAWRWGDLHTVTLSHPFSLKRPLQILFSRGPYPAAGASTALVSGEFSWNDPFRVIVAASFRQVFDLQGESWSVLAGGESGQVFHDHFDDQVPLWINGAYRALRPDAVPRDRSVLELVP
jgi:penicillin amidase